MSKLHDRLRAADQLLTAQLGVATRAQLAGVGLDHRSIDGLVRRGELAALSRRVLRRTGPPIEGQHLSAAVLDAGGDAALSHAAASGWWGIPGFSGKWPEVARTTNTRRTTDLATVHQLRALPDSWVTVHRGIRIVRPELCILELCGSVPKGRAARALDNAWSMRLLSGRSVIALLAQYGEMGRNGTAFLRELIDERGVDYVPPASGLESRMAWLVRKGDLPDIARQVDSGGERWVGRVDFRVVGLPVIIEVQSERYHASLLDRDADRRRFEALREAGFHVVEVGDVEIWEDPHAVITRIRGVIDQALGRSA